MTGCCNSEWCSVMVQLGREGHIEQYGGVPPNLLQLGHEDMSAKLK
jgi:hypothetical protein